MGMGGGSWSLWTAGPCCDREAEARLTRDILLTDERAVREGDREQGFLRS